MTTIKPKEDPLVIVVGGGVSGLMTASMFGERCRVIVIEKDLEPTEENFTLGRPGTLQDRHLHLLLDGGYEAIARYFPDFRETLIANGANVCDRSQDVSWFHTGVWKRRYKDGGQFRLIPRPSIDKSMRECLKKKFADNPDQVTILYGKRVVDLVVNENDLSVNGVKLDDGTMLNGTLVVDAAGKLGAIADKLNKLGFQAEPELTTVTVNLTYSTQVFEFPPEHSFDAELFMYHPNPGHPHGGCAMRINHQTVTGGRAGYHYVLATQIGYGEVGCVTCHTNEDYLALFTDIPVKQIPEMLAQGKPMYDKPYNYVIKVQAKKHWEMLKGLPDGFLTVGDAVCVFNPVYAQGISHATMGIARLAPLVDKLIWGKSCNKARRVLGDESYVPFLMNSIEDFRFASTEGNRFFGLGLVQNFAEMMCYAQAYSTKVSRKIWPVMFLQTGPLSLLDPRFIGRVLWYGSGIHTKLFG